MNQQTAGETKTKGTAAAAPPKEKPESPAQVKARETRAALGHIVAELQKGSEAVRQSGAALFAAHMGHAFGRDNASKLTPAQIQEYAANFRAKYPAAWGRVCGSNAVGFIQILQAYGLEHGTATDYQATAGELSAV